MRVKDIQKSLFMQFFEERIAKAVGVGDCILDKAMAYASLDGGKRVRPTGVYLGALAAGGYADLDDALDIAVALEFIHSYSLVHDDLPCMDDDDIRRGKPTVHKRYGYATAVLTGDALLTRAMCLLSGSGRSAAFSKAAGEIAYGALNMVYGQQQDIDGCETREQYLAMYANKTGALFVAAFRAGAYLSEATEDTLAAVTAFAKHLGLAFQLADDLLDDDVSGSVLSVVGREDVVRMLQEETTLAVAAARGLCASDQLLRFANELMRRTY